MHAMQFTQSTQVLTRHLRFFRNVFGLFHQIEIAEKRMLNVEALLNGLIFII